MTSPDLEKDLNEVVLEGRRYKVRALLKGPSEDYGCSPGRWIYTGAPGKNTQPTGYSLYEDLESEGYRTKVKDNLGEDVGTIEVRRGVRGAVLIHQNQESEHPTATAALYKLMTDVSIHSSQQ